jgi:hypothetical protein
MKSPRKALAFIAAVAGTALVLSTSAFALGGGSAPASAQWRLTLSAPAWSGRLTALLPGVVNDTEFRSLTVTNGSRAKQTLRSVTASIKTAGDGDAQNAAGADLRGCRASWFAVSVANRGRPLPALIPAGDFFTARIALTMRDTSTDEDACRNRAPAFTVTAGS